MQSSRNHNHKQHYIKCELLSKYHSTAIQSPDVFNDEPSTSDSKPASSNQTDLYEEKIKPSENDFDLEPAEPTELAEPIETTKSTECTEPTEHTEPTEPIEPAQSTETTDTTETTDSTAITEPTSQNESMETNEEPVMPCDD